MLMNFKMLQNFVMEYFIFSIRTGTKHLTQIRYVYVDRIHKDKEKDHWLAV
jgi:hypothetical protein